MKSVLNIKTQVLTVVFALLLCFPNSAWAVSQAEFQQVEAAILSAVRNVPDPSPAALSTKVNHVAIVGSYALADVTYGEGGGEVLLVREQQWTVVEQGGGAMNAETLIGLGVPPEIASDLVEALQAQWTK